MSPLSCASAAASSGVAAARFEPFPGAPCASALAANGFAAGAGADLAAFAAAAAAALAFASACAAAFFSAASSLRRSCSTTSWRSSPSSPNNRRSTTLNVSSFFASATAGFLEGAPESYKQVYHPLPPGDKLHQPAPPFERAAHAWHAFDLPL